ncbi:hypothetical protein MMJ09_27365, partial [Bacillus vallismortis]|nr:hypothetical protein [Bacillus vallismortis]
DNPPPTTQPPLTQVYDMLVPARQSMTVSKADDPVVDYGSDNDDQDKDKQPKVENPEDLTIDLEKQREDLKSIAADI